MAQAEARRHQLVLQINVYKSFIGFTLGVGTITTNMAAVWGVGLVIIMYMYAVIHNVI